MLDPVQVVLVVVAGLLAGVVSGLFGVGGGILMVPAALYLVPGTDFHLAKAASLLVVVGSGAMGIATHAKRKSVDFRTGLVLAAGGVSGSALAVWAVEGISGGILRVAFGLLLALTGLRLTRGKQPEPRDFSVRGRVLFALALGFVGGLLAGAFGIGGGVLMVPGLVLSGVGVHLAVGTSLVAVFTNSIVGTLTHLFVGYGQNLLALGVPLVLGAVPGARLGAQLAHRLHAERLRTAFGIFLVLVGLAMGYDALR